MTQAPPPPPTMHQAALPPNRGGTILALGIISIVTAGCGGVPGFVCGLIAMSMAGKDRSAIAAGMVSREGEGLITAGKICGIIGLIFSVLNLIIWAVYLAIFIVAIVAGAAGAGTGP